MGSGKTTQALKDVEGRQRVVIYSPGCSNKAMNRYPFIYDTADYLRGFERYLSVYPQIRVEKRAAPTEFFKVLSRLRGYTIVLDDLAALTTSGPERNDFQAFIRTVRFNNNPVIITTHRARADIPPLVRAIGTSFYYVGPGTKNPDELKTLYELVNFPLDYAEFCKGIEGNKPHALYAIRRVS